MITKYLKEYSNKLFSGRNLKSISVFCDGIFFSVRAFSAFIFPTSFLATVRFLLMLHTVKFGEHFKLVTVVI